jgi:hypothetical protein
MALWRIRAEVAEQPGRLAALARSLAAHQGNILGLSVQPGADGTIDEFFIDAPSTVSGTVLVQALIAAGGRHVVAVPAGMRDLVDGPTRALLLAARVRASLDELPAVLAELLSADESDWAADDSRDSLADEGILDGGGMILTLRGPDSCLIRLRRYTMPFTPTEVARALAMIRLAGDSALEWDGPVGSKGRPQRAWRGGMLGIFWPYRFVGRVVGQLFGRVRTLPPCLGMTSQGAGPEAERSVQDGHAADST